MLSDGSININAIAGVMLIAMGGLALNQIQEHKLDKLMDRTKNRPIPSGKLSIKNAFFISFSLLSAGLVVLFTLNIYAGLFGVTSIFLYNGVYTYLKRITPHATLIGGFVGVIPPVIGAITSNGITESLLFFIVFVYMWQVPHFNLLLINFKDDYIKAGFKTLASKLEDEKIMKITKIWIYSMNVPLIFLFYFYKIEIMTLIGYIFIIFFIFARKKSIAAYFKLINIQAACIMLLTIMDSIVWMLNYIT